MRIGCSFPDNGFSAAQRPAGLGDGASVDSEISKLLEEFESLGVKFTVVPLLDGSLRLNCWRTQESWPNRDRINQLLAERIEKFPKVAAQLAELINNRSQDSRAKEKRPRAKRSSRWPAPVQRPPTIQSLQLCNSAFADRARYG